jgi:O-glycosyl hydrolase
VDRAPDYLDALLADPTTMAHVQHLAAHDYAGSTGGLAERLHRSAYPDRTLWMTEWSQNATDGWLDNGRQVADEWRFASVMTDDLISVLNGGASAALAWDAFDNVHEHCGCEAVSRWGLLSGEGYAPKPRFMTVAHVFKFVSPGWQRVLVETPDANLRVVAFADPSGSQVTIVGHNTRNTALRLRGTLPTPAAALHLFVTTRTRPLQPAADVPLTNAAFEAEVPADSFFTLTTRS